MARQNKNDAEYFPHDADMRNDIKVKALRRKFSHTGYAVWCFILEALTDSEDFEIEYTEVTQELLAADFDLPVEKLNEIIGYSVKIGLLQQEDGKIYSNAHKARFAPLLEARERRRQRDAERAEINRINGRKGGNPNFIKGNPNPYYQKTTQEITESVMSDNPEITENITEDNHSKGKQSRVKESKGKIKETPKGEKKTAPRFSAPTVDEVREYIRQQGYNVDAEHFVDYYTSNGWKVGRNPMKDWRATVRTWASRDKAQQTAPQGTQSLGVGEFINKQGIRTYGTSGQRVPQDAAPRPSEAHYWSDTTQRWEKTI